MKLPKKLLKVFVVAIMIITFVVGSWLRSYWNFGDPDITYWLSNILLSCFGFSAGSGILLWSTKTNRIQSILGSLFMIIVGSYVLIITIRFILMGCPAPGC